MKVRLLDRLRCPACRQPLHLTSFVEERIGTRAESGSGPAEEERVVREGVLLCERCKTWYPITNYLPVLLRFVTPLHDGFAREHGGQLRQLEGYGPPQGRPRPGEASVQKTFTEEWDQLQQDGLSFYYTLDDLKSLNRQVWLRWAESASGGVRSVLNVGIGLGRETEALHGLFPGAEVIGVDLNVALLRSAADFRERANLHFVVASLFDLPFAPESFDLVYSQGVIHHTYSTREALRAIAGFVAPRGYLFVWVYGRDDHLVLGGLPGASTRIQWRVESVVRPLVSRAPAPVRNLFFGALTLATHPLVKSRAMHKDRWRWRNTNHGLRDWLSPRYAHRHSYNEVLEWYEELGFRVIDLQSPSAYRRLFGKRLWGVGVTGQRG